MFGICNLANIPLRIETSDRSEIISQVLFGEHFEVLEQHNQWRKIRLQYDNYEGWVDSKQFKEISESEFNQLSEKEIVLSGDMMNYISNDADFLMSIPLGSSLSFMDIPSINSEKYVFEGLQLSQINPKANLIKTSYLYLNAPYLWGGKTPFGIDCSGFTQMVYKLNGYHN